MTCSHRHSGGLLTAPVCLGPPSFLNDVLHPRTPVILGKLRQWVTLKMQHLSDRSCVLSLPSKQYPGLPFRKIQK